MAENMSKNMSRHATETGDVGAPVGRHLQFGRRQHVAVPQASLDAVWRNRPTSNAVVTGSAKKLPISTIAND
jgi:hypothetical protein